MSKGCPYCFNEFVESGFDETVSPFLTEGSRHWSNDLPLRASILAAFSLALSFALSFFPQLLPFSHILLILVYFLAGIPSLIDSINDTLSFEINIDVLMTLAAFLSILIGNSMEGGLLLVLFSLSGAMESSVTHKARGTLSLLNKLSPSKATVLQEDGSLLERATLDVTLDTHILVKAGEIVPLDGTVIKGASSVNLVHLTGENFPISKKVGDTLPAGARNLEGALVVKVTKTSAESTLAKIIKLITEAQEAKPKLQRWLDDASRTYSLSIISATFLLALTLPFLLGIPFLGHEGSIYRSLAFLIAASPCALIIAIPIAYLSAISSCASQGILLKGGVILDALSQCSVMALDKTGTLTTGELSCTLIEPLDSWTASLDEQKALAIAMALERNVVHPIAKAILSHGENLQLSPVELSKFHSLPGFGLEGIAHLPDQLAEVSIGHTRFIQEKLPKEKAKKLKQKSEEAQKKGELLSILKVEDTIILFHFRDSIREKTVETVKALEEKEKLKLFILSGDHHASVENMARQVGITNYFSELRPEDKLLKVTSLAQNEGLAMVGDGVNDAPALARATVGISMGKVGSSTTIDISDIVLLHDNLETLPWLIKKARVTQNIVKQNVTLATLAIIAASLLALAGIIPLWLAVILHEGGTVLVGLNSLRLLKK